MVRHHLATVTLAAALALAALPATPSAAARQHYFILSAPGHREFSFLAKENAGSDCGGSNVSPALHWSDAPAGTKSYALEVLDLAGNAPAGYIQWVAYDIPATVTKLAAGAGSKPGGDLKDGKNTNGDALYAGPCPPQGAKAHPYVFLLMATDLAPDALAAGLDRDQFAAALKGHILDRTTLVLRYKR